MVHISKTAAHREKISLISTPCGRKGVHATLGRVFKFMYHVQIWKFKKSTNISETAARTHMVEQKWAQFQPHGVERICATSRTTSVLPSLFYAKNWHALPCRSWICLQILFSSYHLFWHCMTLLVLMRRWLYCDITITTTPQAETVVIWSSIDVHDVIRHFRRGWVVVVRLGVYMRFPHSRCCWWWGFPWLDIIGGVIYIAHMCYVRPRLQNNWLWSRLVKYHRINKIGKDEYLQTSQAQLRKDHVAYTMHSHCCIMFIQ